MAYDAAHGVTVLHGGSGRLRDTWEWDGTDWSQRSPATNPYPRMAFAMAYDTARARTVVFGGDFLLPNDFSLGWDNETWEWDGTNWLRDWTAAAPSPRMDLAMAYDAARGRMVLFGGDGYG